ncbi:hypothetical protein CAPTEDRAFT_137881 [Capitella teleta]|uniref:Uncharacterized protein n=1 Tax=Capitella teleta TaxID=283909 RepID=R7TKV8_CAPTE|nr:hypothetical protein CAPTEDRAFT_137881 [Capitella teleta]|eukprot:ELT91740.1 hypothetical protein CAPTEDRAFT_137881 [Capitella teleta]
MLPQNLAVKTETDRRRTQEIHEQEYQQALITIKDKIRESEGPDMKERMQDQIRQWFIECRDASGKFPEYPDEDEGGSGAIFKEKDPAEIEAELKAKDGKDGKGKKGKKEKKDKKKDKKEKKGKKGDDDEEDEGWKMAPSSFVPAMGEATETYSTVWEPKDEGDNFSQKHDVELIKEEKRMEVETEVRVQIDELMRQELKNLKLVSGENYKNNSFFRKVKNLSSLK